MLLIKCFMYSKIWDICIQSHIDRQPTVKRVSSEKMKSIVHISDLHFGRPYIQDAGNAVLQFLADTPHEALICSGDIVQFAENISEWKAAQKFFSQISSPTVVVPGNHDILRFFPVVRWLVPMNRYFRYIYPSRDMQLHLPGLDIVGLGTMRSWTIELGFISQKQLAYVEEAFRQSPKENVRILVQHQAPTKFNRGWFPTHVRGYKRALRTYAKSRVDLILTGHNHFVHAEELTQDGHRMIWSQVGTTTSKRFPMMQPKENSLTRIDIGEYKFDLVTFVYQASSKTFVRKSMCSFLR